MNSSCPLSWGGRSEWSREGRYSLIWCKRYRYDDIIMGFYGAAGYKRILFSANQRLGHRFQTISFLGALYNVLAFFIAHHHAVHIACLNWIFIIFHHLPFRLPANYLPSLFLSIVLVGGSFFPTFAEEIFVYYISADLESKVRHLWWPNFLHPNN